MLTENNIFQSEADNLRSKAKHALRLAESLPDQYASHALKTFAATLSDRAQSLEHGARAVSSSEQPVHQQQHQSREEN
jgi:hypothetical protein